MVAASSPAKGEQTPENLPLELEQALAGTIPDFYAQARTLATRPAGEAQEWADQAKRTWARNFSKTRFLTDVREARRALQKREQRQHLQRIAVRLGKQVIDTTGRSLSEQTSAAIEALRLANEPTGQDSIYERSGKLCRIVSDGEGRLTIEELGFHSLRQRLDTVAAFMYTRGGEARAIYPPEEVVYGVLVQPRHQFPRLNGITRTPLLRADGSILDTPGYDPVTKLLYLPAADYPAIPMQPTNADLQQAIGKLAYVFQDFPFSSAAARAHAFAATLSPFVQTTLQGPMPAVVIEAPKQGTGKTLLALVIAALAEGKIIPVSAAPATDEEWEKRLTTWLDAGQRVHIIDNVTGEVESASFNGILTSGLHQARRLGKQEKIIQENNMLWLLTANNAMIGTDTLRRTISIRLDANSEQPWLDEKDYAEQDLLGYILAHHAQLVCALLTIARAWWANGCPQARSPKLGSFEQWARTVGGILEHAGIAGFLSNLQEWYGQTNDEASQWGAFFEAWYATYGDEAVTVADVKNDLTTATPCALVDALPPHLSEAFEKGARHSEYAEFVRRLGNALSKRRDMVAAGYKLQEAGVTHKVKQWQVKALAQQKPAAVPESAQDPTEAAEMVTETPLPPKADRQAPQAALRYQDLVDVFPSDQRTPLLMLAALRYDQAGRRKEGLGILKGDGTAYAGVALFERIRDGMAAGAHPNTQRRALERLYLLVEEIRCLDGHRTKQLIDARIAAQEQAGASGGSA